MYIFSTHLFIYIYRKDLKELSNGSGDAQEENIEPTQTETMTEQNVKESKPTANGRSSVLSHMLKDVVDYNKSRMQKIPEKHNSTAGNDVTFNKQDKEDIEKSDNFEQHLKTVSHPKPEIPRDTPLVLDSPSSFMQNLISPSDIPLDEYVAEVNECMKRCKERENKSKPKKFASFHDAVQDLQSFLNDTSNDVNSLPVVNTGAESGPEVTNDTNEMDAEEIIDAQRDNDALVDSIGKLLDQIHLSYSPAYLAMKSLTFRHSNQGNIDSDKVTVDTDPGSSTNSARTVPIEMETTSCIQPEVFIKDNNVSIEQTHEVDKSIKESIVTSPTDYLDSKGSRKPNIVQAKKQNPPRRMFRAFQVGGIYEKSKKHCDTRSDVISPDMPRWEEVKKENIIDDPENSFLDEAPGHPYGKWEPYIPEHTPATQLDDSLKVEREINESETSEEDSSESNSDDDDEEEEEEEEEGEEDEEEEDEDDQETFPSTGHYPGNPYWPQFPQAPSADNPANAWDGVGHPPYSPQYWPATLSFPAWPNPYGTSGYMHPPTNPDFFKYCYESHMQMANYYSALASQYEQQNTVHKVYNVQGDYIRKMSKRD